MKKGRASDGRRFALIYISVLCSNSAPTGFLQYGMQRAAGRVLQCKTLSEAWVP